MKISPVVLALSLAAALFLPSANAKVEYPWLADLEAAEELAKSSGKPLLAVFR